MRSGRMWVKAAGLGLLAVFILLSMAPVGMAAEKFPSKEITIVVPYPAGGPPDLANRVLAEFLKKELGVPVIVENRVEANGVKGVIDIYRGKPDGYTLLGHNYNRTAYTELSGPTGYKILELTYMAAFMHQSSHLVVDKDSPVKSFNDLIAASKKKSLNCSILGQGSISHLLSIILKKEVGIDLEPVPFKGAPQAMMALLGGNVDVAIMDDLTLLGQAGKVRSLAIFSTERSKKFPEVPTFKELGKDFPTLASINGTSAPPGLPEPIRKTLSDALAKAIKNPEFIKKIDSMGPAPIYMTGAEFRSYAETNYKDLQRLVNKYKDILLQ
jgi:tripartite-type tricarboxylate transporter receptor subunit TctC